MTGQRNNNKDNIEKKERETHDSTVEDNDFGSEYVYAQDLSPEEQAKLDEESERRYKELMERYAAIRHPITTPEEAAKQKALEKQFEEDMKRIADELYGEDESKKTASAKPAEETYQIDDMTFVWAAGGSDICWMLKNVADNKMLTSKYEAFEAFRKDLAKEHIVLEKGTKNRWLIYSSENRGKNADKNKNAIEVFSEIYLKHFPAQEEQENVTLGDDFRYSSTVTGASSHPEEELLGYENDLEVVKDKKTDVEDKTQQQQQQPMANVAQSSMQEEEDEEQEQQEAVRPPQAVRSPQTGVERGDVLEVPMTQLNARHEETKIAESTASAMPVTAEEPTSPGESDMLIDRIIPSGAPPNLLGVLPFFFGGKDDKKEEKKKEQKDGGSSGQMEVEERPQTPTFNRNTGKT